MIRRTLLLMLLAGVYIAIKRNAEKQARPSPEHAADAHWANEGGANAPASV